jgi:hypothetical protein
VTMPVKYFAPRVFVKLCIIDLFLLEISVAKLMTNLNVCSARNYLCSWFRFNSKNYYGRYCVLIWYISRMLLIRRNSDKDI